MIGTRVRGLGLTGAALVVALMLLLLGPARATAEVEWSNRGIETTDPSAVTFYIRANNPGGITSATVNYRVLNPDGNIGGTVGVEVPSGDEVDLRAELPTNNAERYIPVGSEIIYSWEFAAEDGVTTTPEESFVFLDGRYEWQEASQDGVTVYWYGDNEADAMLALEQTHDSILSTGELLQVEMPYPVRVVVWRNSDEGRAAQRPRGGSFEQNVITGGSRVSPDLLHIYDALGAFVDVARHEAAHLVTKVAGDGPFTRIPSWLDEGTAVYAQNSPGGYEVAIRFAITSNQTLTLRSMNSPTNRPDLVNLFYGQAWSVVKFMIDEFGEEDFAELYRQVKGGLPTDEALQEVYGLDQDTLYNAWRESVGLEPIEFAERPTSTSVAAAQGTRQPLGIPSGGLSSGGSRPSEGTAAPGSGDSGVVSEAQSDDGGSPVTALIVLAVTLVVAGALGGLGFMMMRSRSKPTAS